MHILQTGSSTSTVPYIKAGVALLLTLALYISALPPVHAQATGTSVFKGREHFVAVPKPECGNGAIERDEQCDDGNKKNNDGCSSRCVVEKEQKKEPSFKSDDAKHIVPDQTPALNLAHQVRTIVEELRAACLDEYWAWTKRIKTMRDLTARNLRNTPEAVLSNYCITNGYKAGYHKNSYLWVGEALKIMAKLLRIQNNDTIDFTESAISYKKTPFTDITPTARYRTYVDYLLANNVLDGDFTAKNSNPKHLKALTPIKKTQLFSLIEELWGINVGDHTSTTQNTTTSEALFDQLFGSAPKFNATAISPTTITRSEASALIVISFPEIFKHYRFLVGNNVFFYERLMNELQRRDDAEQRSLVKHLLATLDDVDVDEAAENYRLDIPILIELLENALGESSSTQSRHTSANKTSSHTSTKTTTSEASSKETESSLSDDISDEELEEELGDIIGDLLKDL